MHTSLGKLLDHLHGDLSNVLDLDATGQDIAALRDTITDLVTGVAHYVVSDKIVAMVDDRHSMKVFRSIRAMVEAGVARLPFDPMLVEFRIDDRVGFVRLQSKPFIDGWWTKRKFDFYGYPVICKPDERPGCEGALMVACIDPTMSCMPVEFKHDGPEERPFIVHGDSQDVVNVDLSIAVVMASALAMVMLNARGVIAEPVDTTKLNKARSKGSRSKKPIGSYTVIRIGHIYDASGKAHDVAGSGRHMPVHWRAGHVRYMRYGPAGPVGARLPKDQRPTRPSYIEPCLVNFDPLSGPAPLPKKEVMF